MLSMTPSQYKNAGQDQRIHFAVAPCALGFIAAAFTEQGVCSIDLGGDVDDLSRLIKDRFSRADLSELKEEESRFFHDVLTPADHTGRYTSLLHQFPRDIRSTLFQERVWQALQRIPRGETRTYSQIAAEIGRPSAVRAVANACGKNPMALVIPCHRVVRTDGSPGGYRWGTDRISYFCHWHRQG